jgi:tetratricopeptide (TPR) repeat protein
MKLNVLRASQAAGVAILLAVGSAAFADDLDDAYAAFQAASKGDDTAQIKKTALDTCAAVKKLEASPVPENPVEKDDFTKRVEWGKSIQVEAEYAIYSAALKSPTETKVELLSALEQENPKSRYMEVGYSVLIGALSEAGQSAKAPEVAERAVANFPNDINSLLVLTEDSYTKGQKDKAVSYAKKMVAAAGKSKPEDLAEADWTRLKGIGLSRGYWYAGVIEGEKNQYFPCNADLRQALPLVKGTDAMYGAALYYLGVCNYRIGHETQNKQMEVEAQKFFADCAQVKGRYSQPCFTSAAAVKAETAKMR